LSHSSIDDFAGRPMEATTQWFHVFRSMVDSGDLARMKGSSIKVYLIIKAHVNMHSGFGGPSIETISEKADLSVAQVKRAISELEAMGYLAKDKQGRSNRYRVREMIQIRDQSGAPAGMAVWDYVPVRVQSTVSDLKGAIDSMDIDSAKMVTIEKIQVNINRVDAGATIINMQDSLAMINPEIRGKLSELLRRAGAIEDPGYTQGIDDTDPA
jgi:DNA-binding transcriptional MocR family regulator